MRVRITFNKTAAMRFTGHLDLHRTWEHTLRRAQLPLAYSQGFSPHPKINIAAALPLGFTSQNDLVDVWFEQPWSLDALILALRQAAPPGIHIQKIEEIDDHSPTLQSMLEAADYEITFLDPFPELDARVQELMSAKELIRERRGKTYNLRALILELKRLPDDEQGRARLSACLAIQANGVGRPEEVAAAMGYPPLAILAHRIRLVMHT